jgi:putative transcriptional regulator
MKFTSKIVDGMTPAYARRLAKSLLAAEAAGKTSRMVKVYRVPLPAKPDEVRELRKTLHFKREELAEVLGVSAEAVRSWELGKRTPDTPVSKLLRLLIKTPELVPLVRAA